MSFLPANLATRIWVHAEGYLPGPHGNRQDRRVVFGVWCSGFGVQALQFGDYGALFIDYGSVFKGL